jgi:hypothetical protein
MYNIELLQNILSWHSNAPSNSGASVAFQYFFNDKPLTGTPWGGIRWFPKVLPVSIVNELSLIHGRPSIYLDKIPSASPVFHYWSKSIDEVKMKHNRYLQFEGHSRLKKFGLWSFRTSTWRVLSTLGSVIRKFKIVDGKAGLLLSIEFVRYTCKAELEHFKISRTFSDRSLGERST